MIEIKFRAWDKNNKRFVPDSELQVHTLGTESSENGLNKTLEILGIVYELQQFTGLKDKNGKEIYEGDIMRCNDLGFVRVEWTDERFGWSPFVAKNDTSWEVVGNIYENPELLK